MGADHADDLARAERALLARDPFDPTWLPADPGVWDRLAEITTPSVIVVAEANDRGRALEQAHANARRGVEAIVVFLAGLAGDTRVPATYRHTALQILGVRDAK